MKTISVLLLTVILAGCSPAPKSEEAPGGKPIVLRGSNTFGEELAPALIAEYKKDHPNAAFDAEFKGTSFGMGALLAERCDIAAASRPPTTNEVALGKDRSIELTDQVIGGYAVAVIVHAANPVASLTSDQVRDIFTGIITNWKDVGGPDAPIVLYIRDPISGTYLGFRELAMENKPYATTVKTANSYDDIAKAVAGDAHAIGYTSVELPQGTAIKALNVGDVAPTVSSVQQGKYPYHRQLHLFTNKTSESPAARDFISFIQSAKGQQVLLKMEFVPRQ